MEARFATAFAGTEEIVTGPLAEVALAVHARADDGTPVLVFDDRTGRVIDLDLRGNAAEIAARYASETKTDVPRGRGGIDETLVLGLARLESAQTLEDAVRFLSPREKLAVLADPAGLDRLALLPRVVAAE